MLTRDQLPKDYESILQLLNGDIWLYSDKHSRQEIGLGLPEYKVYSAVPETIKAISKIDGVKESAIYFLRKGKAFDFIVQSFAVKSVLMILQDPGLRQLPLAI